MKRKFSILIPMYNSERTIERCIQSVLNQSYCNYEIILINDGSKDNSENKVINMEIDTDILKYYSHENMGLFYVRQEAISHSSGDYIVFLDSDDTLEDSALEIINNAIETSNAEIIWFNYNLIDRTKKVENDSLCKKNCFINKRDALEKLATSQKFNNLVMKSIKNDDRAKLLIDDSICKSGWAEDLLQTIMYIQKYDSIYCINEYIYNYIIDSESMTQSKSSLEKTLLRINDLTNIYGILYSKISEIESNNKIRVLEIEMESLSRLLLHLNMDDQFYQNINKIYEVLQTNVEYIKIIDNLRSIRLSKYKLFFLIFCKKKFKLMKFTRKIILRK